MGCPFHQNQDSFWVKIKKRIALLFRKKNGSGNINHMGAANLQAILDTTVDSIITINEECIIQTFNKAAEQTFGYKKEDIIGKNINTIMPEPYHSEHDTYVQNYLRTGQKKIIGIARELVAKKKDGSTFPMDLAVSEVIVENRRLFTGIIRDVTGRKEAEAIKLENIRIEAEMKAKSDFLTMISHELRTPLHAIMGFTECLASEIDGQLNETQKNSLQHSYNASKHLLELVNDVLELAKKSSHQIEMSIEKSNLIEIFDSCLDIIRPLANKKNIQLEKRFQLSDVAVKANTRHVKEILLNLLGNAVKFTDQGKIICSVSLDSDQVKISIEDTGIGIDPTNLQRIFIPFARLSNQSENERPGIGLGLAITKQLIETYKGTITISSQKGKGTIVTVYLPLFSL